MRHWVTACEEETVAIGRSLATELAPRGVLLLYGDLGSGKTVLTRGVAAGLGIDPSEVQSPTFTLIREHEGPEGRLVHVDLYRLSPPDVDGLGLDELLAGEGVKVIEWSERLPRSVEADLRLELVRGDGTDRREIRQLHEREAFSPQSSEGG